MSGCAITPDGRYVATATAYPDNSIYLFDVEKRELKWRKKSFYREVAIAISISKNKIDIWTGKSEATKRLAFSLDFEGSIVEGLEILEKVKVISQGSIESSVKVLIELLSSNDESKVMEGLKGLKENIYRFRKNVKQIAPYVSKHLLSENVKITELSRDLMVRLGEKDPEAIEPHIEAIIKSAERAISKHLVEPPSR